MKTIISILIFGAGMAFAVAVPAQDFYEIRLETGEAELHNGQPLQAITDIRIAAFGFLERPPLLCRALADLAVAQERAGRREDQRATIARFVEIERRFAVYQKAEIPDDVRSEFTAILRKHLPAATLASLPAFSAAVPAHPPERRAAAPTLRPTVQSERAAAATPRPTAEPERAAAATPRQTVEAERRVAELERRVQTTPPAPRPSPSPGGTDRDGPPSESVDQPARIRTTVRPVYPADARKAGVGGNVQLRVLVSDAGIPLQVEVIHGIRPDLAEAAIAAVRQWRFEPARRGNRNVAAWTSVSVPFQR